MFCLSKCVICCHFLIWSMLVLAFVTPKMYVLLQFVGFEIKIQADSCHEIRMKSECFEYIILFSIFQINTKSHY